MADKRYSILTNNLKQSYVSGSRGNIELHEIYFGSLRKKSIKRGLVVPLTREEHRGTYGVHGSRGHALDERLKKDGQRAFEKEYPGDDFIQEFGKNYL